MLENQWRDALNKLIIRRVEHGQARNSTQVRVGCYLLKLLEGHLVIQLVTHNTTKGNPSIFLIPSEVIYNVSWIYCFENSGIIVDAIENTNASIKSKPNTDNGSKELRIPLEGVVQDPSSGSMGSQQKECEGKKKKESEEQKVVVLHLQNAQAISSKLDDKNFLSWKMQAMATIRGHRLQKYILGEKYVPPRFLTEEDMENGVYSDEFLDWEAQDAVLLAWLLNSMGDVMVSRMVGCAYSYQIWARLEELFASRTLARERQLKAELKNTKKGSSSMTEYILKIKKTTDALSAIGSPVSARDHMESILDGLGDGYEGFLTSFSMQKDSYNITELEALLLSQEVRNEKVLKVVENVSANVAQKSFSQNNRNFQQGQNSGFRGGYQGRGYNSNNSNSGYNSNSSRGNFQGRGNQGRSQNRGGRTWQGNKPQCQVCGRMGHIAINCYNRFNQSYTEASLTQFLNQNKPNNGAPVEALLATPETLCDDSWFADSGASNHLTNSSSNLQVKQPYDGEEQVHIANGSGLKISGIGFSKLLTNGSTLKLNQILHVPDVSKNLLSISKFAKDNNVYFEFHSNRCFVKSQVDHKVLLEGRNKQGLYLFDNLTFGHKPSMSASKFSVSSPVSANAASSSILFDSTVCSDSSPFGIWHSRLVPSTLSKCTTKVTKEKPITVGPTDAVRDVGNSTGSRSLSSGPNGGSAVNEVVVARCEVSPTVDLHSGAVSSQSQTRVSSSQPLSNAMQNISEEGGVSQGSSIDAIKSLVSSLNKKFSLKDLGTLNYFLGLQAKSLDDGGLLLTQTKYVKDLLIKAGMDGASSQKTHMVSSVRLSAFVYQSWSLDSQDLWLHAVNKTF
ncbi:Retrovirus-related Pol polyprotein from transposon TNT 1-94 [Senna tora]|uniref:Retrovirus-related Pol polyprotein from transposon TNT 1-94 n=1 Tax=Senna tora TaxID=362788 RepID=A0A834WSR7_9FABA|nr:Retrovirus-related Pol polyprotein from transposon TNT 1-94 [Senna tora]